MRGVKMLWPNWSATMCTLVLAYVCLCVQSDVCIVFHSEPSAAASSLFAREQSDNKRCPRIYIYYTFYIFLHIHFYIRKAQAATVHFDGLLYEYFTLFKIHTHTHTHIHTHFQLTRRARMYNTSYTLCNLFVLRVQFFFFFPRVFSYTLTI